jgi:hypothetical protein
LLYILDRIINLIAENNLVASVKKRHPLNDIHTRTREEDLQERKLVRAIVDKVVALVEEKLRLSTRLVNYVQLCRWHMVEN